jgi:hypothetical protein
MLCGISISQRAACVLSPNLILFEIRRGAWCLFRKIEAWRVVLSGKVSPALIAYCLLSPADEKVNIV